MTTYLIIAGWTLGLSILARLWRSVGPRLRDSHLRHVCVRSPERALTPQFFVARPPLQPMAEGEVYASRSSTMLPAIFNV